ncbi:hypothetical protein DdX_21985 [Ditylenchus destructor]|uniref:F-box domain-containing protein n=1 Tax=Ditylenchus destructor TaxID=166010 RepID=A0AAD4MGF2_9BILA|nr:hypothetical protein DdX_21985 [Ditylenchus destructor]
MNQSLSTVIPFGLLYDLLTCFDRRELCQLRNVNRRHYTVIESKFGSTPPYLVFCAVRCNNYQWTWAEDEDSNGIILHKSMPQKIVNQLSSSMFVRFTISTFNMLSTDHTSMRIVLSMNHIWENFRCIFYCYPNFAWNAELARSLSKTKSLEVHFARGLISYLHLLTPENCLSLTVIDAEEMLNGVVVPWSNFLHFLFKSSEDAKTVLINTKNAFNHQQGLDFLGQVKQKFSDSLAPPNFSFRWFANNGKFAYENFILQDQTKQSLRFHCNTKEFCLTVEKQE